MRNKSPDASFVKTSPGDVALLDSPSRELLAPPAHLVDVAVLGGPGVSQPPGVFDPADPTHRLDSGDKGVGPLWTPPLKAARKFSTTLVCKENDRIPYDCSHLCNRPSSEP